MLNPRLSLVYGQTGQVVEFYPPESALGQASGAATYSVWALDADLDGTAEFSGTATLDNVSTTFDANSGFSNASLRDRCFLTATTNIAVGRTYLASNAIGQKELVIVDAITAAAWVSKEGPLGYDYTTSDTFLGLRHYFTIDATWVADEDHIQNGWRILWTYAIGGVTYKTWTGFDLVRVKTRHQITEADIYARFPDMRHQQALDERGQGWRTIIGEAERHVDFDLRTKYQLTADELREPALYNRLVLSCAIWKISETRAPKGRELTEFNSQMRMQYYQDLNALEKVVPVDKGTSGGANQIGSGTTSLVR
jgi:hypothetical protein